MRRNGQRAFICGGECLAEIDLRHRGKLTLRLSQLSGSLGRESSGKTAESHNFLLFIQEKSGIAHTQNSLCASHFYRNHLRRGQLRCRFIDQRVTLSGFRTDCSWEHGTTPIRPGRSAGKCSDRNQARNLGGEPAADETIPVRRRSPLV